MTKPFPEHWSIPSFDYYHHLLLDPVDWGGSEREEIKKHVAAFKAHQVCFMNEHEEFAVSVLRSMRQRSPCNVALKRLPESR